MEVILDGVLMISREAVHDLLLEKLELPDYYGRNLDALYDLLSEYPKKLNITVIHKDAMRDSLGNYANALLRTFEDAASAFENIEFSALDEIF